MSTSYFITPFNPWLYDHSTPEPQSSLRIDPTDYRAVLLRRWPTASEWPPEHFAAGIYWNLDEYNLLGVEVNLHTDLQNVSLSSSGINLWETNLVSNRTRREIPDSI